MSVSSVSYHARQSRLQRLFFALLALDILFLALHLTVHLMAWSGAIPSAPKMISISQDRSIPEFYLYLKWLAASALFFMAWIRGHLPVYGGFAFVFLVVLFDDALRLHEGRASIIADWLGFESAFGLRAGDFAELLVWAILGAMIVPAILLGLRRTPADRRALGYVVAAFFCALLVFGIGVDMLHVIVTNAVGDQRGGLLDVFFDVFEDGSEMVIGSIIAALAFAAFLQSRDQMAGAEMVRTNAPG